MNKHRKLNNCCPECNKEIDDRATFCRSCGQVGKRSSSYKHGLSKVAGLRMESYHGRESIIGYTKWMKDVFERDNYKCQHCSSNKKLRAHHIYSYAKYPELQLQLENGITLCEYHHRQLHQLFGKNVKPKQLKWFFKNVK